MRKSIFSIALCLVLLLSMSTQAFAAESGDIKVTYSKPDPEKVTVVDLAWGSMEFNYNSADTKVWNPETMKYDIVEGEGGSWAPKETGGDTVTVTNHSNTGLLVTVTYTPDADNGVSGTLENSSFRLISAVGTDEGSAPSAAAKLVLENTSVPAKWSTEGATTIGNITVTLDHCDATVSTLEELEAAIAKGGTIVLMADVTIPKSSDINVKKNTVIDLNGHTITTDNGALNVMDGATLTVSGEGTMIGSENYGPIAVYDGSVNLLGCTIDGNVGGNDDSSIIHLDSGYVRWLYAYGEKSVISGGQVDKLQMANAAVTVTGGTVNCVEWYGNGTLTITGGTFGFDPTEYLAEGYTATYNEADGIWTVTAN